jgi:hypothetical protein
MEKEKKWNHDDERNICRVMYDNKVDLQRKGEGRRAIYLTKSSYTIDNTMTHCRSFDYIVSILQSLYSKNRRSFLSHLS